mgnify:CR=1 FL=1
MEKSKLELWEDTEIAELERPQMVCLLFVDEEEDSDERRSDDAVGLKIAEAMFGKWGKLNENIAWTWRCVFLRLPSLSLSLFCFSPLFMVLKLISRASAIMESIKFDFLGL